MVNCISHGTLNADMLKPNSHTHTHIRPADATQLKQLTFAKALTTLQLKQVTHTSKLHLQPQENQVSAD